MEVNGKGWGGGGGDLEVRGVGGIQFLPLSISLLLCLLLPPDWPPLEREEQEVEERCMHGERREQDWETSDRVSPESKI